MSKDTSIQLKGIAILLMLWLHLFSSYDMTAYYTSTVCWINGDPLPYALRKLGAMCVPMYAFLGGIGLTATYTNSKTGKIQTWRRVSRLYTNLWAVLLLFYPMGATLNPELFLTSPADIIQNAIGLKYSFNGAWWFLLPYALIILASNTVISHMLRAGTRKETLYLLLSIAGWLMAYMAMDQHISTGTDIADSLLTTALNTLTIFFPFLSGVSMRKHSIVTKLKKRLSDGKKNGKKTSSLLLLLATALAFVKLCIGGSGMINPWFAIAFIMLYAVSPHPRWVEKTATFFGRHSTNMWLTHNFFFFHIFGYAIYRLEYPLLIYAALILLSLLSSAAVRLLLRIIPHKTV
ncbi:MAG: hypothetical protein K2H16_07490 [Prevotella sp.]|nr:hypothetical protein [Prevotella sp.]